MMSLGNVRKPLSAIALSILLKSFEKLEHFILTEIIWKANQKLSFNLKLITRRVI